MNPRNLTDSPQDPIPCNLGVGCTQRLQDVWWAETTGIDVEEYVAHCAADDAKSGLSTGEDNEI